MPANPVDTALLKNTPVLTDIAVTALAHVLKGSNCGNPETNPAWDLDGKSWLLNDTTTNPPTYVEDVNNAAIQFGIFPNPNNGVFKAAFHNIKGTVNIRITNLTGRTFMEQSRKAEQELTVVPFDLTVLPKGIYFIQVTHEGRQTTRKIVLH